MKRTKVATCICMAALVAIAGCSKPDSEVMEKTKAPIAEEKDKWVSADPEAKEDKSQQKDEEGLKGTVRSIGENSVVISKIFIQEGGSVAVMPGEGSEDEELITVSFSDETIFEKKTVKNGGTDVSTQKASFSDITEGAHLELTGYYEGENFYAIQATIYHFIH